MNEDSDTMKQLERALMLARNGKLRWICAAFCAGNGEMTEIISVPNNLLTQVIGNLHLLMRDVSNKTGQVRWEGVEDMSIPEPCEQCDAEVPPPAGRLAYLNQDQVDIIERQDPQRYWQYLPPE